MASTFTSTEAAAARATKDFKPGTACVQSTYTITAGTALVDEDIVEMVKVPKGARVTEVILTTTDLDSDLSPAIVVCVGDGVDEDRYIAGSTIGQTGGTVRMGSGITTATNAFTYTADDTIDFKVKTVAATAATTFTIQLIVFFITDL